MGFVGSIFRRSGFEKNCRIIEEIKKGLSCRDEGRFFCLSGGSEKHLDKNCKSGHNVSKRYIGDFHLTIKRSDWT